MIHKFKQLNPNFSISNFNFFDKKAFKELRYPDKLNEADISELTEKLKAMQRLIRLVGGNEDLAFDLYERGFHSAYQIASMPRKKFIDLTKEIFATSGNAKPESVYKNALARKTKANLTYTAIAQQTAPHYKVSKFNNYNTLTNDSFNDLPSYKDLFGDLNFCSCKDCRSVLSPAAYFVDLMRLQAHYLEVDSAAYPLKNRRGDLWNLELSCGNTNTLIPKLEIVNKVLLNNSGLSVEEITQDKNNEDQHYESLDDRTYPFNLPFNLPLTKINQYLEATKTSLSDIWQRLSSSRDSQPYRHAIDLDIVGLSFKQWKIFSTKLNDTNEKDVKLLAEYYGMDPNSSKETIIEELQKVPKFLEQTGLDRHQLDMILSGDLSPSELKTKVNKDFFVDATGEADEPMYIGIKKSDEVAGVEVEVIENLTFDRLDHLNRFIRLSQALNWSVVDADWIVRTASCDAKTEGLLTLDEKSLPIISFIKKISETDASLSIDQICSFVGIIKDFGRKNDDNKSFFDTIYNNYNVNNPPEWRSPEGKYELEWIVPKISSTDNSKNIGDNGLQQQIQSALTSALKMDLELSVLLI